VGSSGHPRVANSTASARALKRKQLTFGDLTFNEHECLRKYVKLSHGDHLDIGTNSGGSAASAAFFCEGTVYSLDIVDKKKQPLPENVICMTVDSHKWHPWPGAAFGSCFIDGDHSTEGVLLDWELCKSLSPEYIALHDANLKAVQAALIKCDFDPDYERAEAVDKIVVYGRRHE